MKKPKKFTKPEMIRKIFEAIRMTGKPYDEGHLFFTLAFADEKTLLKICNKL